MATIFSSVLATFSYFSDFSEIPVWNKLWPMVNRFVYLL
jgi:hypothetical protein